MKSHFAPVPHGRIIRYGPGEVAKVWKPGDFLLTHSSSLVGKIIRFGQRLRIHGDDVIYAHWSHAALVTSETGDLVEALGRGVSRSKASKYDGVEYHVIRTHATERDRFQAVEFASWSADNYQRYGFMTILSLAFTLTTGAKFSFYVDGTEICSGLVARALERTGAIFVRDPSHCTPADLAKHFEVPVVTTPPPPRG